MGAPAIDVQGLSKEYVSYRKAPGIKGAVAGLFRRERTVTKAVKDVTFQIQPGEFVGVLGPNGAGKTTTLKMLSGLLYPTHGTATVLGYTPWERLDPYRRQFALLLGQKNQLWWDLPARESLELNSRIYGLDPASYRKTVSEMCELLEVTDKLDVMVRELSLGERMKMELIAALLHQPSVLFLDEPTIGLDVVSQKTVREFLKSHNKEKGTTILLTSHYMADIQELCKRVLIIDHGTLVFDGLLSDITNKANDTKVLTIESDECSQVPDSELEPWGRVVDRSPAHIKLRIPRDKLISACKFLLDRVPIKDLDIGETPIEEVIRRLFNPSTTDTPSPDPKTSRNQIGDLR